MKAVRLVGLMILFWALVIFSGCSFGPAAIRLNLLRYNEAIADTEAKQFLLNLVRLRYKDPPKTLAIGSVTSSFSFDATAPVGYNVGFTNHVNSILAASAHAADAPTISI